MTISVHAEAALLGGAPWRRMVVLGDSNAEGVRESHDGYPDLSWTDHIAHELALAVPDLVVTNLGQRGLLAAEVRERQLDTALWLQPDLAIVAAGGNDALQPSFAPDELARELDLIVEPLRETGCDVLMIELLNIVASGLIPADHAQALDRRLGQLAKVTRSVASRHGAMLVEMRDHPAAADPGIYSSDRLHLNARGHSIVADQATRVLSAAIAARRWGWPLRVELSDEDVSEGLFWPGPPPGKWLPPSR
jgi:lysophospholipase L1-like esterase